MNSNTTKTNRRHLSEFRKTRRHIRSMKRRSFSEIDRVKQNSSNKKRGKIPYDSR